MIRWKLTVVFQIKLLIHFVMIMLLNYISLCFFGHIFRVISHFLFHSFTVSGIVEVPDVVIGFVAEDVGVAGRNQLKSLQMTWTRNWRTIMLEPCLLNRALQLLR